MTSTINVSSANQPDWALWAPCSEVNVTKAGIRIAPQIQYKITGLNKRRQYKVFLKMSRTDNYKYKLNKADGTWLPNSVSEITDPQLLEHKKGEQTGLKWMTSGIDFSDIKLATVACERAFKVDSLHMYQFCLVVQQENGEETTYQDDYHKVVIVQGPTDRIKLYRKRPVKRKAPVDPPKILKLSIKKLRLDGGDKVQTPQLIDITEDTDPEEIQVLQEIITLDNDVEDARQPLQALEQFLDNQYAPQAQELVEPEQPFHIAEYYQQPSFVSEFENYQQNSQNAPEAYQRAMDDPEFFTYGHSSPAPAMVPEAVNFETVSGSEEGADAFGMPLSPGSDNSFARDIENAWQ